MDRIALLAGAEQSPGLAARNFQQQLCKPGRVFLVAEMAQAFQPV
jgi:hypothetical protein